MISNQNEKKNRNSEHVVVSGCNKSKAQVKTNILFEYSVTSQAVQELFSVERFPPSSITQLRVQLVLNRLLHVCKLQTS